MTEVEAADQARVLAATMAGSPLAKKLGIKTGQQVLLLNAPPDHAAALRPLPAGVRVETKPPRTPTGTFDCVHLFVKNTGELKRFGPVAIRAVKEDGLLWISYPKRTSKVESDITRDVGWEPITSAGLEGVAAISIDEVWSALRFRPLDRVGKPRTR